MKKILAVLLTAMLLVQPVSIRVSALGDFNDGTLNWGNCVTHVYDNACDPTCNVCGVARTVPGHTTYGPACSDRVCIRCGATVPATGDHVYSNACDTSCNVCGATRTPTAHVYDNACDVTCNACGATRTPTAHVYDNACDTSCNVCGAVRDTEHAYDNACDPTCNVCGATRTVEHRYTSAVIPSTCEEGGYTIYTCTVCGDSYTDAKTPALGHMYDTEVVPPTCEENGYTVYVCSLCGQRFTINIPAVGHDYKTTVVEPRCDAEGYDLHTCTVCGDSYKDNFTPMRTEHAYWWVNTFYSCTELCYDEYSCFYCGDYYVEYFAPKGHSPCVYPTIWLCQQYVYCGNEWCHEILDPAGHEYTMELERQEPTCEEDGYIRYGCYGCPASEDQVIPATGHTYTDACDADCDVCDDTRTPPHDYADPYDAACDLCGTTREVNEFRMGDVNGDGKINVRDLGLLQQYLNGWDVDISVEAADVARDGKVNVRDLGKLQQYLNGWDVEFV